MRMYLNALENQVVPDLEMISLNYLSDNVPLNMKFILNQTVTNFKFRPSTNSNVATL